MTAGRSLLLAGAFVAMAALPMCSSGKEGAMSLRLQSTAFAHDAAMPARYTCDGAAVSPPLRWSGVPSAAKSLALIVDDPDAPDPAAPQRTWVHWVLYDLPIGADGLAENVKAAQLPAGTRQGLNDWKKTGYGAACPPKGRHRYVFKLYALDRVLPDLHQPDKARLLEAMEGHVLAHAELIGTYQRGQ
ncbi:MAG: YbhB/YbcL family Raf kinase inhibitor-like protein [Luteimonas sp.]